MLKAKSVRRVSVLIAVISTAVLGFGSVAHAGPIPSDDPAIVANPIPPVDTTPAPAPVQVAFTVVSGDTFSTLIQTHCGTSDWGSVSFPGRDKNLIFLGETISIICPSPGSPAAAPVVNEPVSLAVCGGQTPNFWNEEQRANAAIIVHVGVDRGIPRRGLIIALMTAMQESTLHNYGYLGNRNDHDSQGLFQQRPSMGWGTVAQVTDPVYAANKFYDVLLTIWNWQNLVMTLAAQRVQISAYPYAYAKWETDATILVDNC